MSLATFTLADLARYTPEGSFPDSDAGDFRCFYVGRDDVHGVLKHLLEGVALSAKLNMFGYDDDTLNALLLGLAEDPRVMVQVTLDKSQAAGAHEKAIIESDIAKDAGTFAADFAIGESSTHQISHTKGGVLDGLVGFEGSTNWSSSGEGTGISLTEAAQAPGWKAQNNTLCVYTNPVEIAKFAARLDYEHGVAAAQERERKAA